MKIFRSKDIEIIAASHEDLRSPGVYKRVFLEKADFIEGRIQMVNWAFLPKGKSFRSHYHEDMQEVFIIIKGHVRIVVDSEQVELCKGDTVVIPVGSVHMMENTGKVDVEYIVIGVSKGTGGKTIVV
jgi:mannose-6-phosphate isomerase-like protein (cupin superfamily)